MSSFFSVLVALLTAAIFVEVIICLIKTVKRQSVKKLVIAIIVSVVVLFVFALCGMLTDPAIRCEHQYEVISETEATCDKSGEIVSLCPLCKHEKSDATAPLGHDFTETSHSKTEIICRCTRCNEAKIIFTS